MSLASARQAKCSADDLRLYVSALARYDLDVVEQAVIELGNEEIGRGETRWPELGRFIAAVQRAQLRKRTASVAHDCPHCAHTAHPGFQRVYGRIRLADGHMSSKPVWAMTFCSCRRRA